MELYSISWLTAGRDEKFKDIWVYWLLLRGSCVKLGQYYLVCEEFVWDYCRTTKYVINMMLVWWHVGQSEVNSWVSIWERVNLVWLMRIRDSTISFNVKCTG